MKSFLAVFILSILASCSGIPVQTGDNPTDQVTPIEVPSCSSSPMASKSLNAPWKNSGTTIVIDAFEGNPINWDQMATDKRVVAVIHRSSIGSRVDRKYEERRKIAKERGYLWGAYHFGYRGNTKTQADLLIKLAGDDLMILDLEDASNSNYMNLDEAMVFMEYVKEKTGRIPVVYANHSTTRQLNAKFPNSELLKQAKFWYARFKSNVTDFPVGIWKGYFLWQFSSEINCSRTGSCLYNVPGTLYDMDINVFDGSAELLKSQWNNGCN